MKLVNLRLFFIIALSVFLLTGTVYSQKQEPIKLGLKVAPNIGWLSPSTQGYSSGKASFGGTLGFISEFYFTERYAITTGLNFSFLSGNMNYADNLVIDNDTLTGSMTQKVRITYLEIPLMVKMNTKMFGDFSFYGLAGFAAGFNLASKTTNNFVSVSGLSNEEKKDYGDNTTLMRGSVNIGIGAEYHLDTSTRIFAGITYSNALNNVLKGSNNLTSRTVKAWMNYLELNIGVLF
jgi:hypothetical protein